MVFALPGRRGFWLRALGLVAAALLIFTGQWLRFQLRPVTGQLKAITRADSPDDRVALTFDVTWGEEELAQVLSGLDAAGVQGAFFVGHQWAAMHPTRLQAMAAAGHEIGTLGMKMLDPTGLTPAELDTQLGNTQALLARILQAPVRWYRPFGGQYNDDVIRIALQRGLTSVTWSLDAGDGAEPVPPARDIARRVVSLTRRGDIVHLHASDFARTSGEATAAIVAGLRQRGFRPVTISQLVPAE